MATVLSRLACSSLLQGPCRVGSIYLNTLLGKGSGGWVLDDEVRAAAKRIRRPQPVVFDVGANVGNWSEQIQQLIPEARLYMFEPSPGSQAAIRSKNLRQAKLFPFAVGETAEVRPFYASSETDGSASLYSRRDTAFQELPYQQSEVTIKTLDEVIDAEQIEVIDFMKMDIEGHELFALRGAKRALAAGKIRALSFEFGCGNLNSRTFFRDFWDLLTAANFAVYRITPSGKDIPLRDYYEDHEYFQASTNFVAELKRD